MTTSEMNDFLKSGQQALCVSGAFKGMHATKSPEGYVFLVEDGTPYDFWDLRFAFCQWEVV